jgi:hypothetical protein
MGKCNTPYPETLTFSRVKKKEICPFSALSAPLREPVFPSFGRKLNEIG